MRRSCPPQMKSATTSSSWSRSWKISFAQEDDKFVVDREIQVCGNTVKIPVMSLEIDGQQDLIDEQYLKILQMTLAERRANMQKSNAVQGNIKNKVKKDPIRGGSAVA